MPTTQQYLQALRAIATHTSMACVAMDLPAPSRIHYGDPTPYWQAWCERLADGSAIGQTAGGRCWTVMADGRVRLELAPAADGDRSRATWGGGTWLGCVLASLVEAGVPWAMISVAGTTRQQRLRLVRRALAEARRRLDEALPEELVGEPG